MFVPPLTRLASTTPNGEPFPTRVPAVWSNGMPLGVAVGVPAGALDKAALPGVDHRVPDRLDANQFTPSARPASREASRKLTLSSTCCDRATLMALTTPFGRERAGNGHGALGLHRIASLSTQDDLSVAR